MKRYMGVMVCLFFVAMAATPPSLAAADAPAMVVGRIVDIEGDLLRYVPAEKDWVAVVKDAPFGTEDVLASGSQGMAETDRSQRDLDQDRKQRTDPVYRP